MKNAEIDNVLARDLMKWVHVENDNTRKDLATVYMFYHGKTVLKGTAHKDRFGPDFMHKFERWEPTSNISHAMEVVSRVREMFSNFALCADNGWGASAWNAPDGSDRRRPTDDGYTHGHGSTPELAICKLAIKVLNKGKKHAKDKRRK